MHQQPSPTTVTAAPLPAAGRLIAGFLAAATLFASAAVGGAACRIHAAGAKCETTARFIGTDRARKATLPVAIGEPLPLNYMMLLNSGYFGLPPARDGWVYFRVGNRVVRADYITREVLEDVTSQTNRAFF